MAERKDRNQILKFVGTLCDEEGIRVTVAESAKGGLITGAATLLGGLLGGKNGMLAGGALGLCAAAYTAKDFKSIAVVIQEDMSEESKKILADSMQEIIGGLDWQDAEELVALVKEDEKLKAKFKEAVSVFFDGNMQMALTNACS